MNRRERRARKVAHKKLLLRSNIAKMSKGSDASNEHRTLFDKVFHKKSGDIPVKCQGIYSSVFCKE